MVQDQPPHGLECLILGMAEQCIQTQVVVAQAGKPWPISGTATQNSSAESCDMGTTNWPLNGANFPWLASTSSWLLLTWWALVTGLVASSKATLWDNLVVSVLETQWSCPCRGSRAN